MPPGRVYTLHINISRDKERHIRRSQHVCSMYTVKLSLVQFVCILSCVRKWPICFLFLISGVLIAGNKVIEFFAKAGFFFPVQMWLGYFNEHLLQ